MRSLFVLAVATVALATPAAALADVDIRKGGSSWARLESDGDIYINGSRRGKIEADGDVYMDGSRVGKVESDGDVYLNGSRIGLVEATIEFALEHDDLAEPTRAYMREVLAR